MKLPVLGRALLSGTAGDWSWKFVDHAGLKSENGYPLDQRVKPDSVQPPNTALDIRPMPAPNRLPRPTGKSYTQFALMLWVVSKSETARIWFGNHELMIWLPNPKPSNSLMRSALEPTSIDLE